MTPLADVAEGKWRAILPLLGVSMEFLSGKHGPCPLCGGKDRFRFDDRNQRGGYFCSACGAGDGITLLRKLHNWSMPEVDQNVRPLAGEAPVTRTESGPRDGREACRRLWQEGRPLRADDTASGYLASRGLPGPYPGVLRFLPRCRITGEADRDHLPAMLALVQDPEGNGASVHRTYLDGPAKAGIASPRRLMPGTIAKGAAIRLARHGHQLAIAEGIETALAVTRDYGVPCWAASNAHLLAEFQWPAEVTELLIFGDHDPKLAGHVAAYRLANRALTAREPVRSVAIHIPGLPPYTPPIEGEDWLDHGNAELRDAAE